jgi:hypothetical protein
MRCSHQSITALQNSFNGCSDICRLIDVYKKGMALGVGADSRGRPVVLAAVAPDDRGWADRIRREMRRDGTSACRPKRGPYGGVFRTHAFAFLGADVRNVVSMCLKERRVCRNV